VRGFLRIGVGLAWTMAHLAPGDRVGMRRRKCSMPSLSVLLKLGFVAGPAAVGAHVGTVC
jgi:hypothetical protein